jgi:hypothetical protein
MTEDPDGKNSFLSFKIKKFPKTTPKETFWETVFSLQKSIAGFLRDCR